VRSVPLSRVPTWSGLVGYGHSTSHRPHRGGRRGVSSLAQPGIAAGGIDTREARDGYEAITILEWAAPLIDGVILDLEMPGLDGFAVREEILANAKTRAVPIIVVTGSDAPLEHIETACVLRKPTSLDEIISTVERCLRDAHRPVGGPNTRISTS
jgi:CheY-like chemotaxis protein